MEEIKRNYNPELCRSYTDKMARVLDATSDTLESMTEVAEIIQAKQKELESKYPGTAQKYALFHALTWSSPSERPTAEFIGDDFPGKDAVAPFIDSLVQRYFPGNNLQNP